MVVTMVCPLFPQFFDLFKVVGRFNCFSFLLDNSRAVLSPKAILPFGSKLGGSGRYHDVSVKVPVIAFGVWVMYGIVDSHPKLFAKCSVNFAVNSCRCFGSNSWGKLTINSLAVRASFLFSVCSTVFQSSPLSSVTFSPLWNMKQSLSAIPFFFEKSCVKPVRLSSIATPALYALLAVELRPLLREIGFVSRWRIAIFCRCLWFWFLLFAVLRSSPYLMIGWRCRAVGL